MKNKIFTSLCFLIAIGYCSAQKLTFSDKNFEKAVVANYDLNKDGAIDQSEADKVNNLFISNKIQVRSADDINLFKNVQTVILDGSIIITIDLKNLDYLSLFSCAGCNTLNFKAENLKSLSSLYLNDNKLSNITLKNTPDISELVLASNALQDIDVSSLKKLTSLNLENNQIKKLDLLGNPNLESLNITKNPVNEKDVKRAKNTSTSTSTPTNNSNLIKKPGM